MKSRSATTDLGADVDALFRLPLGEFTGARNVLAARLKKSGRGDDAARVKALVKPSISAWAVNQLHWNHREAFDELIASGERFHKAQTSGKVAVMREALDARRESLAHLTDLATSLLRDAGHNPAPDTIRRITTTLEGISAYASRSDAPRPGHLTADVDPPGFELFGTTEVTRVMPSQKSIPAVPHTRRAPVIKVRQLEETRKAKMAAARVSLQEAKGSLSEARARAKSLEAAQKKALADAKEAEKKRRDAEERLEKAKAASEEAAGRARSVAVEIKEAASALEDAERSVEQASKELEKLFGE
ncbi:MAG TPA: hypothetical protein VFH15_01145 [Pyrinomonadaceae bacterium]|nr:hypothetical protein [Pyrinomonadaceae bacterium]